jgi:TetR/AcrR family transcriptional regulator, lmrAB and yxaGH operons repressor
MSVPTPKISEEELLARLAVVFREYGFEGASLSRLTEATGLERASLYHRFPGGKDQMARAVRDQVTKGLQEQLLAPLNQPGALRPKVVEVAKRIQAFYVDGKQSCLLDTLSLSGANEDLRASLAETYRLWLAAFTRVAKQAGHSPAQARKRAEDAIIQIHGSLVMARVTGERSAFRRVIAELPTLLLGDSAS